MSNQIMAFGEILWDMLPDGKQLGGAPANFAYHCHVLQSDAMVISRIGNDELGREITSLLNQRMIPTDFIGIDFERPTGTVEVELDRLGQPTYQIIEDVAWDRIKPSKAALLYASQIDAICFGSLAMRSPVNRVSLGALLAVVPEKCLKVFDLNLRSPFYSEEVIRNLLPLGNVLKLNDDELILLANLLDWEMTSDDYFLQTDGNNLTLTEAKRRFVDYLIRHYSLQYLILTCGDKGSFLFDENGNASFAPTVPTKVVNTVGAGDAFTAVCVNGILAGWDLDKINRQGVQYAAYVCSQPGAMPTIDSSLLQQWDF